jgi:aminoglycoside phosphotransferase (APT) family kinase protein
VSGASTFVHGDYRLGNTVFAREAPARLVSILDWELATVGDPLADLGYLTATWVEPGYTPGPLALSPVTAGTGFLRRDELAARYEGATGRGLTQLPWYRALALWKAAIFLEGNYRRWREGQSDDPYYETMDEGVPILADLALAELRQM